MIPDSKYQLCLLGKSHTLAKEVLKLLYTEVTNLGLEKSAIRIIGHSGFDKEYDVKSPGVALYFGGEIQKNDTEAILKRLRKNATFILPVVEDKEKSGELIPDILHRMHAFELSSEEDVRPLVNYILEGFGLLKKARRLFISYKRSESAGVANQLSEKFEKAGFTVLLDKLSVRVGDEFKEELWQRFSETDTGIILDTPGFFKDNWTPGELSKASSMGINIFRLIWPGYSVENESSFLFPVQFSAHDFKNKKYSSRNSLLEESATMNIIRKVEALRARSIASRKDVLAGEFIACSERLGIPVTLQGHKFITMEKSKDVIIPAIGVPEAFTFNSASSLIHKIRTEKVENIWLLYENDCSQEKWNGHLSWLNDHLPVKSIQVTRLEQWFKKHGKA